MKGAPFILVELSEGSEGSEGSEFSENSEGSERSENSKKNRSNQKILTTPTLLFLEQSKDFANPKHYGCAEDADEPIVR